MVNVVFELLQKNRIHQFFAALSVNTLSFAHGSTIGWTSPFIPLLLSTDTPLQSGVISVEEASWIGATLCLGALLGTIVYGWIADHYGKKVGLMATSITHIGFWMCILFGTNVYFLYFARFLAGCTGGGTKRTIPLYIADIADNEVRGTLGALLLLATNLGILNIYILGSYVSYHTVPLIMMIFPVLFLTTMWFLPETPYCLIQQNKLEKAKESLMFYRGVKEAEVEIEFINLKNCVYHEAKTDLSFKDFCTPEAKKGMSMSMFVLVLSQFSGCFAIINYAGLIFKESGSDLNVEISTIIVAIIQILGNVVSFVLVDKIGRKTLLLISSFGTAFGLASMGVSSYLIEHNYDIPALRWAPVIFLSFVIFIASIGIICLPFVLLAEILPQKIRRVGCTICVAIITVCAFIALKMYPILLKVIKLYGVMAVSTCVCTAGFVIIIAFIPETKGKDLNNPNKSDDHNNN